MTYVVSLCFIKTRLIKGGTRGIAKRVVKWLLEVEYGIKKLSEGTIEFPEEFEE